MSSYIKVAYLLFRYRRRIEYLYWYIRIAYLVIQYRKHLLHHDMQPSSGDLQDCTDIVDDYIIVSDDE